MLRFQLLVKTHTGDNIPDKHSGIYANIRKSIL